MTTSTPPRSERPRRSRARTFVPLGIAAWVVLEIWLLILIGGAIGGFGVFLLLVAGIVLGGVVVKRAGRRAFQSLQRTVQQAQAQGAGEKAPERDRADGNGLLMLSGLLLMIPGALSDAVGLVLLIPPVRTLLSRRIERSVQTRLDRATGGAYTQARVRRPDGKVVQGEVVHEDTPPRRPGDPEDGTRGPRPPLTG